MHLPPDLAAIQERQMRELDDLSRTDPENFALLAFVAMRQALEMCEDDERAAALVMFDEWRAS